MLGLLTLIPGLASGLMTWLNKKTDAELEKFKTGVGADTTINVEEIRARTALAHIAAENRKADRQSLWTVWMLPAAFALCIFHFGAIVFDSMPLFGHVVGSWRIAALPGQYLTMELGILGAATGVVVTDRVATTVRRIFTPAR